MRKPEMVRIGRRASADNAWLCGDESEVILVAQRMVFPGRPHARRGLFGEGNARCLVMQIGPGGFATSRLWVASKRLAAIEGRELGSKSQFDHAGVTRR